MLVSLLDDDDRADLTQPATFHFTIRDGHQRDVKIFYLIVYSVFFGQLAFFSVRFSFDLVCWL